MPILYSADLKRPNCLLDYINGNNEIYVENWHYSLTKPRDGKKPFENNEYANNPQPPTIYYHKDGNFDPKVEIIWGSRITSKLYRISHPFKGIDDKGKPIVPDVSKSKIGKVSLPITSVDRENTAENVNLVNFSFDLTQVLDILTYSYGFGIDLASPEYRSITNNVDLVQKFVNDVKSSLHSHGFDCEYTLSTQEVNDLSETGPIPYMNASTIRSLGLDVKHTVPVVLGEKRRAFTTIHSILYGMLMTVDDDWFLKYPERQSVILQKVSGIRAEVSNSACLKHCTTSKGKIYDLFQINGKFIVPGDKCDDIERLNGLLTKKYVSRYISLRSAAEVCELYDKTVNGDVYLKFGYMLSENGERYLSATVSKYDFTPVQTTSSSDDEAERLAALRHKETTVITGGDFDLNDISSSDM